MVFVFNIGASNRQGRIIFKVQIESFAEVLFDKNQKRKLNRSSQHGGIIFN